ncbi:MAG TPA: sugar phosphate nucleotidyltransferase [Clostridiales bacterium]|nr:sugar phosphate nucleotidyltransferase [Clostridiales bacterium]
MILDKTLVIMAAGMGSRYGGLKQIESVGPDGSLIIDYSIYDAKRAGFNKVVFIIKKQIEQQFYEAIGKRIEKQINTEYVFQELSDIPKEFHVPENREKPWGTGQAILACKDVVNEPFLVINADDFYGKGTFKAMANWIDAEKPDDKKPYKFAMAGYILKNTLSRSGHVARGVCDVGQDGYLVDINERLKIMRIDGQTKYALEDDTWVDVDENSFVSMNMWCFGAQMPQEIEKRFYEFLKNEVPENPLKAESVLPNIVRDILHEELCTVKVIPTNERWFGVTYKEDKESVVSAILEKIKSGEYPEVLW